MSIRSGAEVQNRFKQGEILTCFLSPGDGQPDILPLAPKRKFNHQTTSDHKQRLHFATTKPDPEILRRLEVLEKINGPLNFALMTPLAQRKLKDSKAEKENPQTALTVHPGLIEDKANKQYSKRCTLFFTTPKAFGSQRQSINMDLVFNKKQQPTPDEFHDFQIHTTDEFGKPQILTAEDFSNSSEIKTRLEELFSLST